MRGKVESEFAKGWFHHDLVILCLSLTCIYFISTKISLRFADDTKVGAIVNTGNNHCTLLTAQP